MAPLNSPAVRVETLASFTWVLVMPVWSLKALAGIFLLVDAPAVPASVELHVRVVVAIASTMPTANRRDFLGPDSTVPPVFIVYRSAFPTGGIYPRPLGLLTLRHRRAVMSSPREFGVELVVLV